MAAPFTHYHLEVHFSGAEVQQAPRKPSPGTEPLLDLRLFSQPSLFPVSTEKPPYGIIIADHLLDWISACFWQMYLSFSLPPEPSLPGP